MVGRGGSHNRCYHPDNNISIMTTTLTCNYFSTVCYIQFFFDFNVFHVKIAQLLT